MSDFIKTTSFALVGDDNEIFIRSIHDDFTKVAEEDQFDKAIMEYVHTKLKPKKEKSYFLINAMGASDYFGSNLNADWFSEPVLEDHHKSFETDGYAYRHHVNKDKTIAQGKVVFSAYNKKMHRVELIVEVDDEKVQDILDKLNKKEISATSMACFKEGTGVIVSNFKRKKIEDIEIGDEVLTHSGKLQKVTELHKRDYSDVIYTIQPVGKYRDSITCTKEHPWLVINIDKFYSNDNSKNKFVRDLNLTISDAVLKTAEELIGQEYLVIPKPKIIKDTEITVDMAKLLGWYLAEGHTHIKDNGVEFTVNRTDQIVKEVKETAKFLNTEVLFRDHNMSSEALRVIIYSNYLKNTCLEYCGKYCDRKILSKEIFSWPDELKLAFLGAYISGDGFYFKNIYISSVNKELLEQIQWLCYSLGILTTLGRNIHKVGEQRFTDYDQTEWILRFRKTANIKLASYCDKIPSTEPISVGGASGPYEYEDFYLVGIDTIEASFYNGLVYNLEIENDETYVVEQYAVHNCKVSHDICSICGNKAKSRQDYCVHLKYFKNKIHSPSTPIPGATKYGQKVYAINPDPRFFDISFVKIPADATSSVLTKLAEAFTGKKAEMTKEVKTPITNVKQIPEDWIEQAHGRLTKEEMKKLLEKSSCADVVTHMVQMNMIPSRRDFQYMYLTDNNLEKYAEVLYDNNITFDCTGLEPDETIYRQIERTKFDTGLAEKLAEFGDRLGMGEPLVVARILDTDFEKVSEQKEVTVNTVPYFAGMGGAYYGYNKWLDWKNKKGLGDVQELAGFKSKIPPASKYTGATWLMRQHPLLLATGLVGAGILANAAQKAFLKGKDVMEKQEPITFYKRSAVEEAKYFKDILKKPGVGQFLAATALVSPLAFLYSTYNRDKLSKGEPVSHLGSFTAHHPFLAAAGGVGATYIPGKILKGYNKGMFGRVKTASLSDYVSYLYLYDNDEYKKLYSDLVK